MCKAVQYVALDSCDETTKACCDLLRHECACMMTWQLAHPHVDHAITCLLRDALSADSKSC